MNWILDASSHAAKTPSGQADNVNWMIIFMAQDRNLHRRIIDAARRERERLEQAELRHTQARQRPCMRCRKTFHSTHFGHRLCNTCSGVAAQLNASIDADMDSALDRVDRGRQIPRAGGAA